MELNIHDRVEFKQIVSLTFKSFEVIGTDPYIGIETEGSDAIDEKEDDDVSD